MFFHFVANKLSQFDLFPANKGYKINQKNLSKLICGIGYALKQKKFESIF